MTLSREQLAYLRRRVEDCGYLTKPEALRVLEELTVRDVFAEAGVVPPRYPVRVTVMEAGE